MTPGITPGILASSTSFPAFIGLIGELNLGSQVVAAGSLFLVAWYVLRAARIGSSIAAVSATAVQVAVSVFIVAALAVGLGWVNPRPSAFFGDARTALSWTLNFGIDFVIDLFRTVVGVVR